MSGIEVSSAPFGPLLDPSAALSSAEYLTTSRQLEAAKGAADRPVLAVLSTHTLSPLKPHLTVEFARHGIPMQPWFADFGQFEQAVMPSESPLWQKQPAVIVIAMRFEDMEPDAVMRYHASSGTRFAVLVDHTIDRVRVMLETIRARSSAQIVVASFTLAGVPPFGLLDANQDTGISAAIARANARLREMVRCVTGAYVWDWEGLVRQIGAGTFTDARLFAVGRIAVGAAHRGQVAAHLARTVRAFRTSAAKVLALDLDNTLWGGVIGDDGLDGIALSDDYPGNVFRAVQRRALALRDHGVLLAIVSKNDEHVVERAFREHPEMLIKWDDLAAARVNWRPKSVNLREIAEELNLGLDSFVFLDDNPVERAEVRAAAPEVKVLEVGADGDVYRALSNCPWFDQAALSKEDLERSALYRQDRERRKLSEAAPGDTRGFLKSLQMVAQVGPATDADSARVLQLIGKTNQFNLTTRRLSASEVEKLRASEAALVAQLRLSDRFGDQGLVVVAIVEKVDAEADITTFVMSCRVMNRQAEHAMMSVLAEQARTWGCTRLSGTFRPSARNQMVSGFYPGLGFMADSAPAPDGAQRYVLALSSDTLPWPEVLERRQLP